MAGRYSYRKSKKHMKKMGLFAEYEPRKPGGRRPKRKKNPNVTMPLNSLKRLVRSALKGKPAKVKARVR
jgi:hypothetical protein